MQFTRRMFMRSSAALAVGAAVGSQGLLGIRDRIREHGPVKFWTYFLSKDPISFNGEVFADDRRDVFGARIFSDDGKRMCIVEMPLPGMKEAIASGSRKVICLCLGEGEEAPPINWPLAIVVENGKVTFLVDDPGKEPVPIWLDRADVVRVL